MGVVFLVILRIIDVEILISMMLEIDLRVIGFMIVRRVEIVMVKIFNVILINRIVGVGLYFFLYLF